MRLQKKFNATASLSLVALLLTTNTIPAGGGHGGHGGGGGHGGHAHGGAHFHGHYPHHYSYASFGFYGGFYGGGFYGFYPYAYQGFYSNGYSMYGPPVPTYAPVPGVFGGYDQRLNYPPPDSGFYGPRAPIPPMRYPAPAVPTIDEKEPLDPTEPAPPPRKLPAEKVRAQVEVLVPDAKAEVHFEGQTTRQQGEKRIFQTPRLIPGAAYQYEVTARWTDNGKEVTRQRVLNIKPGERFVIDFTQPEQTAAAPE